MSRTRRASIAAAFSYAQFALGIIVGIVMVPFVLRRVGEGLYGYWLASGEVLAYAAMADFGILGIVPWMIAEADGRSDRQAIRRVISTGFWIAVIISILYVTLVLALWRVLPSVLRLTAFDRAMITGPLAVITIVTAIVLPLRIAGAALVGLQDVKFYGFYSTAGWVLDLIVTVTLLLMGHGLYGLAIGPAASSLLGVVVMFARLRWIAPDLLTGWPRPSPADVLRLFREGFGTWLGAWGWRLSAASDAIVLAMLGSPLWIPVLAMTGKLGQMLMQISWVPGDNSLVGLAQLSGESRPDRLREAVTALCRVYIALATAGACIVLAANGAFVRGWVGNHLFGGGTLNGLLAIAIVTGTFSHAIASITSVLGRRMHVGLAALAAGAAQIALAFVFARRLGLIGIPLAALCAQAFLLIPLILPAFIHRTGIGPVALMRDVIRPWATRSLPVLLLCAATGVALPAVPLWVAIPLGGLTGLAYVLIARRLVLDYPPVAAVIRGLLARVRLDALVPLSAVEQPRVP